MNGGIDYPPAFRDRESRITHLLVALGRGWAYCLSLLFPGKRRAALLLVANERSRDALVKGSARQVFNLPENGVDITVWRPRLIARDTSSPCRFVFVGRLVRSKGVDFWLNAFAIALRQGARISGLVIGDGPEQDALIEQARSAGLLASALDEPGKVFFAGWQPPARVAELLGNQDCLVFPTLCECGGAVLLEAMAMGLPVVATKWGGPADYVDSTCGMLVPPDSREQLVDGFADAMVRLARDPELRERMGRAGRRKVEQSFSWERKVDTVIGFYRQAARSAQPCLTLASVLVALAADVLIVEL
jgi:glycosyltransferase involved in cell wall biosynthesis